MQNFKKSLQDWNTSVFGDIFQRKKKILRRLNGISNRLTHGSNRFLENLQFYLCRDYKEVLVQEELLWFQKSRSKWLEFGDWNTKFFHGSTMVRRRKNKILTIQNDDGEWLT
ncbi:Putative ribonuclease H protein family [Arachis hypogaea]|uniref:Ribonuclease H protein family n=1 Tax=Arachis hypogaea TaxID=3818 RepID=A0A6B9V607_ARAHY|nr:Putative ribonuclease H protein family [Arachis hypogaea]